MAVGTTGTPADCAMAAVAGKFVSTVATRLVAGAATAAGGGLVVSGDGGLGGGKLVPALVPMMMSGGTTTGGRGGGTGAIVGSPGICGNGGNSGKLTCAGGKVMVQPV